MRLILTSQSEYAELEPVALAVNLAKSPRNAKIMCEGAGLKLLLKSKKLDADDELGGSHRGYRGATCARSGVTQASSNTLSA
jgi:hypothetical protein